MLESANELIFADDILTFTDEEVYAEAEKEKWKLLVVDDELEVHSVTKMVLGKFEFEGRKLEFLDAFSGSEARSLLRDNPDIAVILLDVVMEEDDTGLKMIKFIREELNNNMVRIILRTGQPGQAPEERVVLDYDINDYKEKTELTSQKLYTCIVAALRAYRDLTTIDISRKGLKGIVDTFSEIFFEQSLRDFAAKALIALASIIDLNSSFYSDSSSFSAVRKNNDFYILAATGRYLGCEEKNIKDVLEAEALKHLYEAYEYKKNIYSESSMLIYLKGQKASESIIYFEGCVKLNSLTRELIEVFCSNVSAVNSAITSSNKYEAERQQRDLSEKLRDLVRDIASTLELKEVFLKLLENLGQVVSYGRGLAVLIEGDSYKSLVFKEGSQISTDEGLLEETECEIVNKVVKSGLPYLASGLSILSYEQKVWFQSCLAVPITHQGELYGVILLQNTKTDAFTSADENIALTYASQAGLVIENAILFYQVSKRNADIKNLLDNAGQGFMTFGEDLRINGEYSIECIKIFDRKIEGTKFTELIYDDVEQQNYLEIMMQKVLNIQSVETRELYLPLLPGEICVNGKHIELCYKIIEDSEDSSTKLFMVILTDVTDKKLLEDKMEEEHNTLRMVVKAVTEYEDLVKCINEYEEFCKSKIYEILSGNGSTDDMIFEIMRSIHTFKGSFSQLDFVNVVSELHEFEIELIELKKCEYEFALENLRAKIQTEEMLKWLDRDKNVLVNILGEEYLRYKKLIYIDQTELMKVEERLDSAIPEGYSRQILYDLRKLRYKPFKEVFKQYPTYVEKLAVRLNKKVKPLEIIGGDFLVDLEKYEDFARSLVHVFRNAVDHGVETPEERALSSKCEYASISCTVCLNNNDICVAICDDGNGISISRLRNTALEQGILDHDLAYALNRDQVLNLIFEEFFTTRSTASEYSGRGIGFAAVKAELEKLGGTAEVKTKEGEGTSFIFRFRNEE